jgi:hypothetical protein
MLVAPSANAVARRVADALESAGLDYAIGGAIAYGFWGVPRDTVDVDVTIYVDERDAPRVFALLGSIGCEVDVEAAKRTIPLEGQFKARLEGLRVDVFLPSIPFYETARARRLRSRPRRRRGPRDRQSCGRGIARAFSCFVGTLYHTP